MRVDRIARILYANTTKTLNMWMQGMYRCIKIVHSIPTGGNMASQRSYITNWDWFWSALLQQTIDYKLSTKIHVNMQDNILHALCIQLLPLFQVITLACTERPMTKYLPQQVLLSARDLEWLCHVVCCWLKLIQCFILNIFWNVNLINLCDPG